MGTVFTVPYARLDSGVSGWDQVRQAGFQLWALIPDKAARPLAEIAIRPDGRYAVLMGSESEGLSKEVLAAADHRVRIPMIPGVDSLNVGAAAAVVCYAVGRVSRVSEHDT
jgi:tRNA G18 (ribose-2'-O)-methylase SpoU